MAKHSATDLAASAVPRFKGPFEVWREAAPSRLLLIGDHASNALPEAYGSLGLSASAFTRHIACDLGVAALVVALSDALSATAILAGFSRLLIDPNRGEDDPTLIMRLSDGEIIPGNAAVDEAESEHRLNSFHRPYHRAIARTLDASIAAGRAPLIVSMHSFTPSWRGKARPWQCGVLWSGDPVTAAYCLSALRAQTGLTVGDNQPYSGALEGDCLDRHGTKRGIAHVLIEVRQDLIATDKGRSEWVSRLAPMLAELVAIPA